MLDSRFGQVYTKAMQISYLFERRITILCVSETACLVTQTGILGSPWKRLEPSAVGQLKHSLEPLKMYTKC